jgi:hypothetical protein
MKKREVTPKQSRSVVCPTCGVGVGKRCVLDAGGPRFQSHADRKSLVMELIEKKKLS